jgi:hypothetical protein
MLTVGSGDPRGIQFQNRDFIRVSRNHPCPICGKPDWCTIKSDGSKAFCMRERRGSEKQARNGGFVHLVSPQFASIAPPVPGRKKRALAPADHRDRIYRALLDALTLTPEHASGLLRRGLSEEAIAHNLYASVPDEETAAKVADAIARECDPQGVPGFYKRGGRWTFNTKERAGGEGEFQPLRGFLVPVRDAASRILACQIRRDEGDPRYKWLATGSLSPGAPVHFAQPSAVKQQPHILLTEGPLKADIISELLGACVVAVPGVGVASFPGSSREHFGRDLRKAMPGAQSVRLAFDSDHRTKAEVRRAVFRLAEELETAGWEVGLLDWDPELGKGLDDVLAGSRGGE